jgi:cytochrome c oxidase assembly factor CtaG
VTPAPYSFTWEPLFVVLAAVAAFLYWRAARVERPPWWRIALFAVGLLLVLGAIASPIETLATHYLLIMHLLQNVMMADWAPPLLVLGLTPAMRDAIARRGGRPFRTLTRARFALVFWVVSWYAVHLPVFYGFALRHPLTLNVEHAWLLLAGLLFWWYVLSDAPEPRSTAAVLLVLGIAFGLASFLGLAFIFSTTPFYDFYTDAPRIWGFSAAKDQNLGGILMNGEQTIVFFAALGYFVMRLLDEEEELQRRTDAAMQAARPEQRLGPPKNLSR